MHPRTLKIALLKLLPILWGLSESIGLSQAASAIEVQVSQGEGVPDSVIPNSWMGHSVSPADIHPEYFAPDPLDPLLLSAPENFNPDLFQPEPELEEAVETDVGGSPSPESGFQSELEDAAEPAELQFSAEPLADSLPTTAQLESDRPQLDEPLVLPSTASLDTESLSLPSEKATPAEPWLTIEDLQIDYDNNLSNFGQGKQIYEPTFRGRLRNGTPVLFSTGYNRFELPDFEPVINVPLRVGWQEKFQGFPINLSGGLDLFDRLRPAPNLQFSASKPLGQKAVLSLELTHGLYKFNVETLEKAISSWRYGPSLFWQIDSHTTFFSLLRWGRYSDGNREQQSFSRLEHRRGEFSAALNSFNWRYRFDFEERSGYFSPDDFLVLSAELAWEKDILDSLRCRIAGTLGKQRAGGVWANAYSYDALCTLKPLPGLEIDVGYSLGNVLDRVTGGSAFNNNSLKGQIRITN